MRICDYCGAEMRSGGCVDTPITIRGHAYPPIRHGDEPRFRGSRRCHDCLVAPGEVHHHGCDMERCPACGDQSISCGCIWAGEEHLSDEWIEEMEERFLLGSPDR